MKFRTTIPVLLVCRNLALSSLLAISLGGCSGLTSQVGVPPNMETKNPYAIVKDAISHANAVLGAIDQKQTDLSYLGGGVNLGLLAAGTGAGAAGVYDGSADVIKGFTVAAAGLVGLDNLTKTKERERILETGEIAIHCAIQQTVALKKVYSIGPNIPPSVTLRFVTNPDFFSSGEPGSNASISAIFANPKVRDDVLKKMTTAIGDANISIMGVGMMLGRVATTLLTSGNDLRDLKNLAATLDEESLATGLTLTVERIRARLEKHLRDLIPDTKSIFDVQRELVGSRVAAVLGAAANSNNSQRRVLEFQRAMEVSSIVAPAKARILLFNFQMTDEHVKSATDSVDQIRKLLEPVAKCLDKVNIGPPSSS